MARYCDAYTVTEPNKRKGLNNSEEINENLTAQLRTNHGLSRKIEVKKSLGQGGVLSVTEYAIPGVIYEQKTIIIDNLRL